MACSLVLTVTDVDTVRPVLSLGTSLVAAISRPSHPAPTPSSHSVTDSVVVTLALLATAHAKRSLRAGCEITYTTMKVNHFCTIGRYSGTAHYILSIWQAAIASFITSSFKIFLTQTFPRCCATCSILPSRAMYSMMSIFVYRSVEVY